MARTGRPPKPTALKKLKGTLRKHRVNRSEWKPPEGAPPMPDGLDKVAKAEWKKAIEWLVPAGIVTQVDGRIVESYCRSVARARAAEAVVELEGLTTETQNGCQAHPCVGIARQAWEAARRYGELLGLDPSSRTKLGTPGKPEKDPDDEFLYGNAPPSSPPAAAPLTVVPGGKRG